MSRKGLGEILVQENVISVEQLAKAKDEQRRSGGKLATAMVKLGFLKEDEVLRHLSEKYQIQAIDLENFEIDSEAIRLVSKDICLKYSIIPVTKSLGTVVIACSDPANMFMRDDLAFITQSKVEFVVASESQIQAAIYSHYDVHKMGRAISDLENTEEALTQNDASQSEIVDQEEEGADAPIIRFVNVMMSEAIKCRASDIHIEPYEKRFRVRYRIDGVLHERIQPPPGTAAAIASRIKIMSQLNISEKRKPQDGRLKIRTKSGTEIDFRVSIMPSLYGEKIVLRLLDKSGLNKDMKELGFEQSDLDIFKASINQPTGMVLITGPTGSGKSTTVYSALNELNTPNRNICTAEDPVEMFVEGINHVQANPAIDLSFADLLRSFLRQDPDIIFVGEIRDYETAEISFKAASTGHMVMSTLHTNDAPSTIVRLTEIGVPPYLVTSTVSLVVAQRLVGMICESCKEPANVSPQILRDLGVAEEEISEFRPMHGAGCASCNQTGIRGRIAIHELMPMTAGVKDAILSGATTTQLREIATKEGMRTLRQSGILKAKAGLTTIEEVLNSTVQEV